MECPTINGISGSYLLHASFKDDHGKRGKKFVWARCRGVPPLNSVFVTWQTHCTYEVTVAMLHRQTLNLIKPVKFQDGWRMYSKKSHHLLKNYWQLMTTGKASVLFRNAAPAWLPVFQNIPTLTCIATAPTWLCGYKEYIKFRGRCDDGAGEELEGRTRE